MWLSARQLALPASVRHRVHIKHIEAVAHLYVAVEKGKRTRRCLKCTNLFESEKALYCFINRNTYVAKAYFCPVCAQGLIKDRLEAAFKMQKEIEEAKSSAVFEGHLQVPYKDIKLFDLGQLMEIYKKFHSIRILGLIRKKIMETPSIPRDAQSKAFRMPMAVAAVFLKSLKMEKNLRDKLTLKVLRMLGKRDISKNKYKLLLRKVPLNIGPVPLPVLTKLKQLTLIRALENLDPSCYLMHKKQLLFSFLMNKNTNLKQRAEMLLK